MTTFEQLSETEQQAFLKFPAYITLMAANADGKVDPREKKVAIDFDHMKTYTCDPVLTGFYEKADKVFKQNLQELDNELPKGKMQRDSAIRAELKKLEDLLSRFDPVYAATMHKSMRSFKDHVSRAHHNILEDFIFPIPIKGIKV